MTNIITWDAFTRALSGEDHPEFWNVVKAIGSHAREHPVDSGEMTFTWFTTLVLAGQWLNGVDIGYFESLIDQHGSITAATRAYLALPHDTPELMAYIAAAHAAEPHTLATCKRVIRDKLTGMPGTIEGLVMRFWR
jgi:hypothetical protein